MNRRKILAFGATAMLMAVLPGMAAAMLEIQHWQTDNGARVYFVAAHEIPIVDVRIVFDAGSARDGAQPGLARLTNGLLESGTPELSADAVADRLDSVGARLSTRALRDMALMDLRSLADSEYLMPAVETAASLLGTPAFGEAAVARERNNLVTAVRRAAQSPGEIAEQAFYQGLYGSHPYASRPGGDEASLLAIERDDVMAFFKRYYVGSNAALAIIGALNRTQAEALAATLIGGLPAGEPAPALPVVPPLAEAKLIRIAHPSTQSHVYMGQIGIQRGDPDYYSLYLGNHILGGNGLVSLLSNEVREKRGLSYSTYSFFAPMREPGPFAMVLQTRTDQADEAVQVVRSTLTDFVANGPDPRELEAAHRNITGGFALRIDSNQKILQYLAVIGFYRLPLDYLQTLIRRFEAVSLEQVKSAFQRHMDPDRLVTVIVGG